ncbi:MAG: hypothetical protein QOG68_2247 [Solirubrobacteraceae bacterium]|nr:hypothetical protein [Solirubrobacteraceae bacterium]
MRNRIRYGEKWAGLGALALFGVMFLDWFGVPVVLNTQTDVAKGTGNTLGFLNISAQHANGLSGWDSLGWLALALCVLAIVAGLAVAIVFALCESPVLPLLAAGCALVIGTLAVIALIVQVIFQPGPDELVDVKSGWWLGLLAVLAVARGGYLSMHDEFLVDVPIRDVEVRPAPPAVPAA